MEHFKSLLPKGKKWQLVWNDEFDGTELDTTKWGLRLNFWGKRFKAFADGGYSLDGNGNLLLKVIKVNGEYCSPQLQTGSLIYDIPKDADGFWPFGKYTVPTFMHRYGYYEVRCRFQRVPGWWSAFWLQSPCIGAVSNPEEAGVEVDIMENFERDGVTAHTNHWNGYGLDHQSATSGPITLENKDDFHVHGLEWTPDEYIYYIDGRETWRCNKAVSHREQFVLLTTECMGYRETNAADPILTDEILDDAFVVDYVRVFDEVK